MNLEQLEYFIAVVESGSFSEAAETLFTSQSSVTKHIQSLERELNVVLFDRSRRKIQLTEAGALVLKDTRKIVSVYNHLLQSVKEYSEQASQELKIASIPVMAQYDITGMIAGFAKEHPEIHLTIQEIEGIDIVSRLKNGEFDLAFMRIEHLNNRFSCVPILEDRMSVVLAESHPLAGREELSLAELRCERFLLLNQWTLLYDISVQACRKAGFEPNITYTGMRMDTILGLIDKNQGISLMMEHAVSHIHHEHVRIIPLKEEIKSTIGLARMKTRALPDAGKTFWQYILFQNGIHETVN